MTKKQSSKEETLRRRAIDNPLRSRMLKVFDDGESQSPGTLGRRLKEPLSRTSYHLAILAEAKLIVPDFVQPESAEHFYRLA